ncbi:MAG TPA: hypothetical protein VMM38_12145 [Aridibacter sp.]|nr:hypothetical protein [Aridibacter sp.]
MKRVLAAVMLALFVTAFFRTAYGQDPGTFAVFEDKDKLEKIVPASFFFEGLSGRKLLTLSIQGTRRSKARAS